MNQAEEWCMRAALSGEVADLTALPTDERSLTSAFLRALISGTLRDPVGDLIRACSAGIRIKGLRSDEALDLGNLDASFPLELVESSFLSLVILRNSTFRSVAFDNSTFLMPIDAQGLQVRFNVSATNSDFKDRFCLADARIGGSLYLQESRFAAPNESERFMAYENEFGQPPCLDAERIQVSGDIFICARSAGHRLEAFQELRDEMAMETDSIPDFDSDEDEETEFEIRKIERLSPSDTELLGEIGRPFECKGEIRLVGAEIAGSLICSGGIFRNPYGSTICATLAKVAGSVFMASTDAHVFRSLGEISLQHALVSQDLILSGSSLQNPGGSALSAEHIQVGGSVYLDSAASSTRLESQGTVSLSRACIGGSISCIGSLFRNVEGVTFNLSQSKVKRDVFLCAIETSEPFESYGSIRIVESRIGGLLVLRGSILNNGTDTAFECRDSILERNVDFDSLDERARTTITGKVDFYRSKISGTLRCVGSSFRNSEGVALDLDNAIVASGVYLSSEKAGLRFESDGLILLDHARIGGELSFIGSLLCNGKRTVISCRNAEIRGTICFDSLSAEHPTEVTGKVDLSFSKIGGQLCFAGTKISNPEDYAIFAVNVKVRDGVFLYETVTHGRFEAHGGVDFSRAILQDQLNCSGGRFVNPDAVALSFSYASIKGNVYLKSEADASPFECLGQLDCFYTTVGGNIDCQGARLINPDGFSIWADYLTAERALLFTASGDIRAEIQGYASFVFISVGDYFQWGSPAGIHTVDLRYANIEILDVHSPSNRSAWLLYDFSYRKLAGYETLNTEGITAIVESSSKDVKISQIAQLSHVLQNSGRPDLAQYFTIRHEEAVIDQRIEKFDKDGIQTINLAAPFWVLWRFILSLTNYGFSLGRLVLPALVIWLTASLTFAIYVSPGGPEMGQLLSPVHPDLFKIAQGAPNSDWWKGGPPFMPALHTLDHFIPFLDLGQASFYRARADLHPAGWVLVWTEWALILSGWTLSLIAFGTWARRVVIDLANRRSGPSPSRRANSSSEHHIPS